MFRKIWLVLWLLSLALAAQELPKFKQPLPASPEMCRMGWLKFAVWCDEQAVDPSENAIDQMARHYREVRDEATATEARRLKPSDWQHLDGAFKAIGIWLSKRCQAAAKFKGESQFYGHVVPRLGAELSDLKHRCVAEWGSKAGPRSGNNWPDSFQTLAKPPLQPVSRRPEDRVALRQLLKEEAVALQEAIQQVGKLPDPVRRTLQNYLLDHAEGINPYGRRT